MAKEKAPYMPLYGREYYGDLKVLMMTLEQLGAYDLLNWICWQEGSIPSDLAKLAAICKNTPLRKFERDIWPALAGCYSPTADGRLVHRKVELIRAGKEAFRAKCSDAGKRGNEKRWGYHQVPDDNPIESRSIPESGTYRETIASDCRLPITDYQLLEPELITEEIEADDRAYLSDYIAAFQEQNGRFPEPWECPARLTDFGSLLADGGITEPVTFGEWLLGTMPFREPSTYGMVHYASAISYPPARDAK
jgi:uncharacterized protein YdaU (DUF1376 family)